MPAARGLVVLAVLLGLGACTSEEAGIPAASDPAATAGPTESRSPEQSLDGPSTSEPTPEPTEGATGPTADPTLERARFEGDAAMATVRHLALRVGPREASSGAYRRAAGWVGSQLGDNGYDVRLQRVRVPAGNSWGVDVPAGVSTNVIGDPIEFSPTEPHIVVGAHLDTVPQAPGAEDNASGVAVVLELARMASLRELGVPVRFVAFGAEEPRGEGDDLHHFGSTRYVELMSRAERRALVAMVSLDRVGTRGPYVPACSGPGGDTRVRDQLARSARALGLDVRLCDDNTTSDHWSFTKAGLPSARLGSIPYAGYHSPADLPDMVDRSQLERVGRTMWHWLRHRPR